MRTVGVLSLVALLAAGCSSSAPSAATDAGSATSAASAASAPSTASAPPTAGGVELGTDPGAPAYRALDVCGLVDLGRVATAVPGLPSDLEPTWAGPGWCRVALPSGASVDWLVARPREQLPSAVTAPPEVSEDVDRTADGAVITDKACSEAHVVSKGYVLTARVLGGGSSDDCAALRAIAAELRGSLARGPALMDGAGPVTRADLCERLEATGLADYLGISPVLPIRADHRGCAAPEASAAAILVATANSAPPTSLRKGLVPAPGGGGALTSADRCTWWAPVDEGSGDHAFWVRLSVRVAAGTTCEAGAGRLRAAVDALRATS